MATRTTVPNQPEWLDDMRQKADEVRANNLARDCPMFQAAMDYLRKGLRPLPIHPHEKLPLIQWTGLQSQAPSLKDITQYWTEHPDARVGIVTGAGSDLVVVDVDPRHGGTLEEDDEIPSGTSTVRTPSGGIHLWFRHPGRHVPNRTGIRPGVDVRGDGGLVVAPPSPGYVAETPLDYEKLPVAPDWVLDEPPREGSTQEAGRDWFTNLITEGTPEGRRNSTATQLAGYLLGKGLTPDAVAALLTPWAINCLPQFPEEELATVVASIAKRETEKESPPALRLHDASDLAAQDLRFTIDALVPEGTLTLLFGRDKVGKTLLAMEMIRAVRTGNPFLDHFAAVQGGG